MIGLLQRSRAAQANDVLEHADQDTTTEARGRGVGHRWTAGSSIASRAVSIGLVVALVAWPVYEIVDRLGTPEQAPTAAAEMSAGPDIEAAAVAESVAVDVVRAWLASDTAVLAQLGLPTDSNLVSATTQVVDARAISVAAVAEVDGEPGTWAVVVGVDVPTVATDAPAEADTEAQEQPAQVAWQRAFFQVAVQVQAGSVTVLGYPAPTSAVDVVPATSIYRDPLSPQGPAGEVLQSFVTALLAGAGDLQALTSPGSSIAPVTPTRFGGAEVLEARVVDDEALEAAVPQDGAGLEVLATVRVTDLAGQPSTVQYALSMTARAGRWEVSQIREAPLTDNNEGR